MHLALLVGTVLIGGVFAALRWETQGVTLDLSAMERTLLRVVVLVLIVGGTVGLRVVRAALPPAPREAERAAWWAANGGRMLTLWVFPEGVGVMGAVLYFVSGDRLILVLPFGWAIAMLLLYAPGRIQAG
jgi:hypothetical protein